MAFAVQFGDRVFLVDLPFRVQETMRTRQNARHPLTPPLPVLGVVHTLLVIASVGALVFLRHDVGLHDLAALNPFGSPEATREFFSTDAQATRIAGFFCFASAIPLSLYTALIVSRLQLLGVPPDGANATLVGGIAATIGLAAAGLSLWTLSVPGIAASMPVARALHFLTFLCGGPAFAVGFGLFAAGVTVSARSARLLPNWVVWFGVVIATTGAVSVLGLLSVPLTVAIPMTRVGSFAWLIVVGVLMPTSTTRVVLDDR